MRTGWPQLLAGAAAVLAAASLFLTWTVLSAPSPEIGQVLAELPAGDVDRTGWNSGFLAWLPPLLVVLTGLLVLAFGRSPSARRSGLPQLWLTLAGLALAGTVAGWFAIRVQFTEDQRGVFDAAGVLVGSGLGRYLGLLAALVSVVAAVFDVLAARAENRPRGGHPLGGLDRR